MGVVVMLAARLSLSYGSSRRQSKPVTYQILHDHPNLLTGILTPNKDRSLFILYRLRFTLFQRTLHTSILWFSRKRDQHTSRLDARRSMW